MTTAQRRLVMALAGLAIIEFLHGLDSLRTYEDATVVGVLADPVGLAGIGGALVAVTAVVRGWASAQTLAVLAGSLVSIGFLIVHGLWFEASFTNPYWGDGSADALQWAGVFAVWGFGIASVVLARELEPATAARAAA
jgi:hypothetical protein